MSCIELQPAASGSTKATQPVTLGITVSKRMRPRLFVTVRTTLVPELTWWLQRAAVSVRLGADEHAGLLRVTPGGPFQLSTAGGAQRARPPILSVLLPIGVSPKQHDPVPVEYDYTETWLEITLPDWARPQPAPAAKPAARAAGAVVSSDLRMPTKAAADPFRVPPGLKPKKRERVA